MIDNLNQVPQNLWIGNMTLTFFCASKVVLNFRLEQNHNNTQYLTKFLAFQFPRAYKKISSNNLCDKEFFLFEDSDIQHKDIFLRGNKQQH